MKRVLLTTVIVAFATVSCKKGITDQNIDTKSATVVPAEGLFANAQRSLSDQLASTNVNTNIFRLIVQHWTQTVYTDESRYDLRTRLIPDRFFQTLYRDVLEDFADAKRVIGSDTRKSAGIKANQIAIADIMEVYTYHMLVNTFGNVPYGEALNYANITPKYDDAKTIELDLLARLNTDIAALNANISSPSYGSSDFLYGGNVSAWIKFANTLKLKIGMLFADSDPAVAQANVLAAVTAGVFTSNSDNALFKYLSATPNTNPLWVDLIQSGRNDFVASQTIVNMMNGLNDPRRTFYFTQVSGGYSGGVDGQGNVFSSFSGPSSIIEDPTVANVFLDYSETEFLLAEAVERGFVAGTAATHYNNAVTASILYWGGAAGDATTYLAQPSVAYATAVGGGTYKQKIGQQKYLALYNRGFDVWTEWRRLDYPVLSPALNATTAIPVRFTYPIKEQNLNGSNSGQAAAAIGGDLVSTKLFWDKF
jgi:hypothetical protein